MPFKPVDFDPFAESSHPKYVETTEPQREIWTSVKIGGDAANCAYNESVSLRLNGNLDYLALITAINSVIERHDALRTTFSEDGTMMKIVPSLMLELPVIDLMNTPEKVVEEKKWLIKEVETPFSLETGPLMRVHVLKLGVTEHLIVITAHHIICDGWSISIIMQDIANFYSANVTGKPFVKEEAIQFSEYARQEQQKQPGPEHEETEKFWLNAFKDVKETLELPIDKLRPPVRTFRAKRIDVIFEKSVIDKLKQIGTKAGCSFVNTLTVAYEIFLYRITGNENIVLGIPASGQSVTGQYDLVGHCVNLLPLRSKMRDGVSFIDHLKIRKKEILDAFDHQEYTFGSLINKLNLSRDPGRIPLVPVIFNVDAGVFDGVSFQGLDITFYSNPRSFENFEIFINAANYNGQFTVECTFNTDLFDEEMMHARMMEFNELLASIVNNPDEVIDKLNILPISEKTKLLELFNQTSVNYAKDKGIHQLFEECVHTNKNKKAVQCGNQFLNYQDLHERANRLANHLLSTGINSQSVVGLCTDRDPDMVVALLAILKCGATYLPLDPGFPKDRIQFMLDDSEAGLLITGKKHLEKLGITSKNSFLIDKGWEEGIANNITTPQIGILADQRAYIIYTSGSTGKPKGVQVSHQSMVNLLTFFQKTLEVKTEDNLLAVTTISFDIAGLELFLPLVSGATLTVVEKEEVNDAQKLMNRLQSSKSNIMQATPVTWRMLIGSGWKGNNNLQVLCGGEALSADLAEQLVGKCKNLFNVYGPTETTVWSTIYKVPSSGKIFSPYVSIGKPLANTTLYVLDKNLQPAPLGIAGELHIGGDGVSLGYYNRPDLNNERFLPDPYGEFQNKKLYKTGDLVRYKKDGTLEFINRIDNQVKVRGYRIELGEIEAVLSKIPGIINNVVITRKDKSGENRLIAYYIKSSGQNVNVDKLRSQLQADLPEYMVPSAFVELKSFPLTPNEKIDRKALPEPDLQITTTEAFIPSRTANENLLSSIWSDLLGVQKISMNDDFFKLGGHSLLAVKLIMEIEKHRKIKLPLAILFTNSTIEKLARVMETEIGSQVWNPIVPIKTKGNKPPVYFAHGVSGNVFKYHALSALLPDDQPCYGLQAYGLNGKDEPFDNLEEMASYHIREILKFQPEENAVFTLAGGSFGGYLAYEMAYQLLKMGKKVEVVALFDIDAATAVEFLPFHTKYFKVAEILVRRLFNRAIHIITADKEERDKYLANKMKSLRAKNELDVWLNKEELESSGAGEQAAYFNKIEDACYRALMNYKIKTYMGNVILFRAKSGYFSAKYDYDLGWKHFVKGNVEVVEVPGDHNSIFNKGNVEVMAEVFSKCLEKIKVK